MKLSVDRKACSIAGCSKPARRRGWCSMHYSRWQRNGDPLKVSYIQGNDQKRFESKFERTEGCWEWTDHLVDGYGHFRVGPEKIVQAHRYAYELEKGPIPDGLVIDHLCRNRACVNPDHLEPVTHQENILRGEGIAATNASKETCKNGHEYDLGDGRGRRCSQCRREYQRKWARQKRAAS